MPDIKDTYPLYKAPAVSPETVWLFNSLCIRQSPWNFSVGSVSCTADMLPWPAEFVPACSIDFFLDQAPCTAELSDTFFCRYHEAFSDEDSGNEAQAPADVSLLPEDVRRAILLSLAAPVLQGMGNALGAPVAVKEVRLDSVRKDRGSGALGFKLVFSKGSDEKVLFACIRVRSLQELSGLGEKFRTLPVRRKGVLAENARSVPLQIGFEAGYACLKPEDVKSLAADDVIIPEEWTWPQSVKAVIWHGSGRHFSADCKAENGTAILTSPLMDDKAMENTEPRELELRLTFELEQRLITLAELEALTEGYTFALKCDNESPVTIRANGMSIAQGRLVDINGTLGVQITRTI